MRLTASTALTEENKVHLQVSVSDTGIGIEEAKIAQLFDKFTQEDSTTTRQYGGTGLGLSITKELTELMSGTVNVVSKKNQGTTLSLSYELAPVVDAVDQLSAIFVGARHHRVLLCLGHDPLQPIIKSQLATWHIAAEDVAVENMLLDERVDAEDTWLFVTESCFERYGPRLIEKISKIVVIDTQHSQSTPADLASGVLRLQTPITPMALAVGVAHCADSLEQVDLEIMAMLNPHGEVLIPEQELDLHDQCILIVDDNTVNLTVAEGLLEGTKAKCLRAENGKAAINLLLRTDDSVTMILMDCQMPVMDGYSATAEIRAGAAGVEYKKIPIIAMTAGAMPGDRERCLAAGMDDYVTKPVIRADLYKAVSYFFDRNQYSVSAPTTIKTDVKKDTISMDEDYKALDDFNPASALERLGGRESLWHKVVGMFQQSYQDKLTLLQENIDSNDADKIQFSAHTLKSASASVGLDKAAKICANIEQQAADAETCK